MSVRNKVDSTFVDFRKYGKDNWLELFDVLCIYRVKYCLLNAVAVVYKGRKVCIGINGILSDRFSIEKGVRQLFSYGFSY